MTASESPNLVGIDARHLRLVCQGSPFPKDAVFNEPLSKMSLIAPSLAYPLTAPLVGLRHAYLPSYSRPFPYDAVGRCIYCGSAKYDDSDSRNLG